MHHRCNEGLVKRRVSEASSKPIVPQALFLDVHGCLVAVLPGNLCRVILQFSVEAARAKELEADHEKRQRSDGVGLVM